MSKNYEEILLAGLFGEKYYSNEDLRINKQYGFMLSRTELDEYLKFKDCYNCNLKENLYLKTFNSSSIYYYNSKELLNLIKDYLNFFKDDITINNSTIVMENYDEMILSQIASELEGTLKIEGVNSTRKKVVQIVEEGNIKDLNDQIIFNMYKGYKFIACKPEFNKGNLLKLYKILSYNSLKLEDEIKDFYRDDMVKVENHEGCPVEDIEECMNSLFIYINQNLKINNILLPFIAHYYILYIHPYFDFNGRTARMVALWISLLVNTEFILPTFISEAINDDKSNYYKAIDKSRNSQNDLSYFLIYLVELANKYYLVYKNLTAIRENLALNGEAITLREVYYLKRIIINSKKGWFNYRGFIEFASLDITKQGALKILNRFLELNLLITKTNSHNEKIFLINDDVIKFAIN